MRRFAAAICALLLCTACSEPPQKEIDRAEGAIDAARAAGADVYAPEPFRAATTAMQQTHEAVQQRDYRLALSRAIDANERALEAARLAADGKARAQAEADASASRLATSLRQLEELIKTAETTRVPARDLEAARSVHAVADRALQEARAAITSGNYSAAVAAIKPVPEQIAEGIRALNDAIEARVGRGRGRRR